MAASLRDCGSAAPVLGLAAGLAFFDEALREAVKENVDDRRGVEREDLADEQAADHGDAERAAQFRADARPSARGRPPSNAAMVVIMMGRKRSRQAS